MLENGKSGRRVPKPFDLRQTLPSLRRVKQPEMQSKNWVNIQMLKKSVVTQSSYTLVRDFLFTQIFTDNANFVEVVRAEVTTAKTGHVFLTWSGQNMPAGQISKAVQSVFKKAEIDQKITCPSFRKAAATKVHTEAGLPRQCVGPSAKLLSGGL